MASPRRVGDVLAQLMARRGYAREQSTAALDVAWKQAAGDQTAKFTRAGLVRRGTLEVMVANNLVAQELGFQKEDLLQRLRQLAPDQQIQSLRFRIGNIQ